MTDIYVDFSATNDGDGSTHSQAASPGGVGAYNTLASKTFASGDKVWLRRKTKTVTATHTFNQAGVLYIGWPKSGDLYYSTRPSGAQGSWDGDSADYAEIKCTATVTTTLIAIATNTGQEFHRLQFTQGITTSGSINTLDLSIAATFYNCYLENQNNSAGGGTPKVLNYTATGRSQFTGTTLLYSGSCSSSGVAAGASAYLNSTGTLELISCSLTQSNTSWNPTVSSAGMVFVGAAGVLYLVGCTVASSSTNYAGKTNGNGLVAASATASTIVLIESSISTDSTGQSCNLRVAQNVSLVAVRLSMPKVCYTSIACDGARLHFSQYTQTVAVTSGYSLDITGAGNTITGNNLTFFSGNGSGDVQLTGASNNPVYFQNVVFASSTPFGASPGVFPGVWCADFGGTVGLWKFYGPNGTVTSNNVARTGGETFSLKYDMDSGTAGDPLWRHLMPQFPGFDTIWVSVPGSSSTITVYGAHKGYGGTPPDASDIWIGADYLDQASGGRRAFASSRDGNAIPAALTSDASSWTGDTGLTSFKLTLTFTPGQSGLVPVRIYTKKRTASAYFYIDPKPVVS